MSEGVYKNFIHSKSKTFLAFCFCFILGAGIFSYNAYPPLARIFYAALFPLLLGVIIFWRHRSATFICFSSIWFILGSLRVLFSIPSMTPDQLNFYWGKKVTVTGIISTEPDRRLDGVYYVFTGNQLISPSKQDITGRLLLKTRLYPAYTYGQAVSVACALESPESQVLDDFRYDKYLERQGVWSVCPNPVITPLESNHPEPLSIKLFKPVFALKNTIAARLERLWPEPASSFLAGVLYGARSGLPQKLSDNFSKTGVSHIIAVSGFNITIIATTLVWLGVILGLYRRQAAGAAALTIILFVFFTGASASVVRAGSMGLLVLLAEYLGRKSRIGNVLVFTAAFMVLLNPYVLLWDAGFQLSFLATIGLVYISPLLKKRGDAWFNQRTSLTTFENNIANKIGVRLYKAVSEPLYTTLSAITITLPLILFQFGRLSLVAPVVNILILWIIPWLMLGSFISLILSFIWFPLGLALAFVTHLGVRYVLFVVTWFADQPFAAVEWHLPLAGMIIAYSTLGYCLIRVYNRPPHV